MVTPAPLFCLTGVRLIDALREGGYVLIMRHPSSPRLGPTRADAHPGNDRLERQLDTRGSQMVRAMGASIKALAIRVSPVYCSPAFRAREAFKLAGFEEIVIAPELADLAVSEGAFGDVTQTRWLKQHSARIPQCRSNTLLMTHLPNLLAAFDRIDAVEAGEMLVYRPAQADMGTLVARVLIEDWPGLAMLAGSTPQG